MDIQWLHHSFKRSDWINQIPTILSHTGYLFVKTIRGASVWGSFLKECWSYMMWPPEYFQKLIIYFFYLITTLFLLIQSIVFKKIKDKQKNNADVHNLSGNDRNIYGGKVINMLFLSSSVKHKQAVLKESLKDSQWQWQWAWLC